MLRDPFDRDVFVACARPGRAQAERVVNVLCAIELRPSAAQVATVAERIRAVVDDARDDDPQPPVGRTPVEPGARACPRSSAMSAAVCG